MNCHRRRALAAALVTLALVACGNDRSGPALPDTLSESHRTSMASSVAFSQVGPFGFPGKLNALAIDPADSRTLYIAAGRGTGLESYSSAGIFKTTDGGKHWQPIDTGLTDSSGYVASVVNGLWIDPANPSTLLAATEYGGIFRTENGGSSWTNVSRATQATQIASYSGALYATSSAGVLSSTDDGLTWRVVFAGSAARYPAALGVADGKTRGALYAGMTDGTIYADTGGSWKMTGKLPYVATRTEDSDAAVHQMVVDPLVPTTVYASTNDGPWNQNLHASTDGGHTWVLVQQADIYNIGLGSQALAFSIVHPHRLYIGDDGGPVIYIDANGSATSRITKGAFTGADVRNIWPVANGADDACYLTSDQGLIYVSACSKFVKNGSGVGLSGGASNLLDRHFLISPNGRTIVDTPQDWAAFWTQTGGKSWHFNLSFAYEDAFNDLRPGDPKVCYSYDEAYGLRISVDGCKSYDTAKGSRKGLFPSRLMMDPIAFDPKNALHMYVISGYAIGASFPAVPQGVFESTDGGKTLHATSWAVSWPGSICVDRRNGSHILVGDLVKSVRSSIRVTFDGGKTWQTSAGVPATKYWYDIAISPANGNIVLATSVDDANNVFVLRSFNGGRTFGKVAGIVNAPTIRQRFDLDRMPASQGRDGDADASNASGEPEYFLYSPSHSIKFNQDATSGTAMVALSTLRGAYVSSDDGTSWQRIDRSTIAHSFWGIRWLDGHLYLASDGEGILRSNAALQSP